MIGGDMGPNSAIRHIDHTDSIALKYCLVVKSGHSLLTIEQKRYCQRNWRDDYAENTEEVAIFPARFRRHTRY
jgi:hypothetical protein